MAMIPQIQQVVVKDKGWLSEEEMVDCIAVSQSMPGVIAINSATYIGRKTNGFSGAAAATTGVIAPSFLIIILIVSFLGMVGENHYIQGAFVGIKAAVCGLILISAVKLGKQILKGPFQWILAVAAFLAIGVFGITAVWAVLTGAVVGILYNTLWLERKNREKEEDNGKANHDTGDHVQCGKELFSGGVMPDFPAGRLPGSTF